MQALCRLRTQKLFEKVGQWRMWRRGEDGIMRYRYRTVVIYVMRSSVEARVGRSFSVQAKRCENKAKIVGKRNEAKKLVLCFRFEARKKLSETGLP
jgi:hypothetical protein